MPYKILFSLFCLCMLTLISSASYAQGLSNNDEPVEITADNSLEWLQDTKQYEADGNVIVTQGKAQIYADKLTADYRENAVNGDTEIWQLTAIGNVRLVNDGNEALGQRAVYNIDDGKTVLTGNNLKLTLPDQVITASEKMEYSMDNGKAVAHGNAKIVRGSDTLTAQTITANFTKDQSGTQSLSTANAKGGVKIQTNEETLTGNRAVYNAVNNTAEVFDNVKIVRGPNQLEGARALVNLKTNISQMFGAPESGKRVKGIFYPSSKKDNL